MNAICSFADSLFIYEDGDYWVVIDGDDEPEKILKTENPYYPMAMVTKFDYDPIDIPRLKKLVKEWEKENG